MRRSTRGRRASSRTSEQSGRSRKLYYWILAKDPDTGRPFLIKGGWSEPEAREKAFEMLGGVDFEIRGLRTTNQDAASAIVRGKRLEETHSLKQASARIGHERSVRRAMKRRRRF